MVMWGLEPQTFDLSGRCSNHWATWPKGYPLFAERLTSHLVPTWAETSRFEFAYTTAITCGWDSCSEEKETDEWDETDLGIHDWDSCVVKVLTHELGKSWTYVRGVRVHCSSRWTTSPVAYSQFCQVVSHPFPKETFFLLGFGVRGSRTLNSWVQTKCVPASTMTP